MSKHSRLERTKSHQNSWSKAASETRGVRPSPGGSLILGGILDAILNVANATKFPGGLLLKLDSDPLKTEHCAVRMRWQQPALLFTNAQNPIDGDKTKVIRLLFPYTHMQSSWPLTADPETF
jgi:hypothetical protein